MAVEEKKADGQAKTKIVRKMSWRNGIFAALYVIWVLFLFYAVQYGVLLLLTGLGKLGVSITGLSLVVFQTVISGLVYALTVVLALVVPWWILHKKTSLSDMGLAQRLPTWRDLGLAPLVYIGMLMVGSVVLLIVQKFFPGIDITQAQHTGFNAANITHRYELLMVYLTLGVMAPVAEELLFRGYLFGKLRAHLPAAATVIITAIIFSALHLGLGQLEKLQWNVAIITLLLGVALGLLRTKTGSIWAGIVLHMIQNTVAFLVLFAVPALLRGLF